jgi:hypothetical protein
LVNKFLLNREDIIKMKLAEIGFDTGWWIELVQDRIQRRCCFVELRPLTSAVAEEKASEAPVK